MGAGLTLLKSYRAGLGSLLVSAGRLMNNATGGGKSYAFANGYKVEELASAIDEAEPIWITYTTAQLAILLDTPPIKTTQARFGAHVTCGNFCN